MNILGERRILYTRTRVRGNLKPKDFRYMVEPSMCSKVMSSAMWTEKHIFGKRHKQT